MKKITTQNKGKGRAIALVAAAAVAVVALVICGAAMAFNRLVAVYERQCCLTDAGEQVEIITGKILPTRLFINHFNLTNGVNLAQLPFAELRERLIRDMPNLRDIKIVRTVPNRVRIEISERIPVVRVIGAGANANPNYTADSEGKVFWYPRRDTTLLPIIREVKKNTSTAGASLSGMSMAALRLLEAASDPEFAALKIQEVDTFKQDYLFATLGDSSRAKIAWEDMESNTKASRESLHRQLKRLSQAMKSNVAAGTKLWNATDYGVPGRIYANDPTKAE
ncbi:MAG: hypothetical protein E7046_03300 [Lentisphaerae bacterium]|nr:hypothetical protein [Lentisphaerota bacterium]